MPIRIAIQSGARQGDVLLLAKPYLTIGRHPGADIRFDPEQDLRVSSRHAAIIARDGIWLLRDLGSTNGTWVNNLPLSGQHVLAPGDVIELGRGGPSFRIDLMPKGAAAAGPAPVRPVERELRPTPREGATPSWRGLDARARPVRLRHVVLALSALAILLAALAGWQAMRYHELDRRQAALLSQADSLSGILSTARADAAALRSTLDSALRNVREVRDSVAGIRRDEARLAALGLRLDSIQQRTRPLLQRRSPP